MYLWELKMINETTGNTLEYTSRERLELTDIVLNENKIKVACDIICFVNLQRINKVNIKETLKVYNEILAKCKEFKIKKIYKNKFKNLLIQVSKDQSYINMYQEYEGKYKLLIEQWEIKIKEGMYVGWQDDIYYHETIFPLISELEKYDKAGSLLDEVYTVNRMLIELRNSLNECDKCTAPHEVYL